MSLFPTIRTGSSADLIVPCSTRDETDSSSLPDESVQKMFAPPLILPFNSAHLIESAKNSTDVSLEHSLIRRISEAKQKPIVSTTRKRSTTKGDRHGQTCYSLGAVIEGSGDTVGLLREGLRLEDSALSGNELPRRRNRRPGRHQRRHHAAEGALARQHDLLHRRRGPRGLSQAHHRSGRQDPRRRAGGPRHGRVLALHGSRGAHDGTVEAGQEAMKQIRRSSRLVPASRLRPWLPLARLRW